MDIYSFGTYLTLKVGIVPEETTILRLLLKEIYFKVKSISITFNKTSTQPSIVFYLLIWDNFPRLTREWNENHLYTTFFCLVRVENQ